MMMITYLKVENEYPDETERNLRIAVCDLLFVNVDKFYLYFVFVFVMIQVSSCNMSNRIVEEFMKMIIVNRIYIDLEEKKIQNKMTLL